MSNMNDVKEFCDRHGACPDIRAWAMTKSNMAEVFESCERGDWLIWTLCRQGSLDKPTSVKLACDFALRLLPEYEKRSFRQEPRLAIEAALRWVADPSDKNAMAASYAALAASPSAAYSSAAASAARAAASAAVSAAYSAAESAAYSAAESAAYSAAESEAQCEIIRSMVKNPWRTE